MTHRRGYCSACGERLGLPCWRGTVQTPHGQEIKYAFCGKCGTTGYKAMMAEVAKAAA